MKYNGKVNYGLYLVTDRDILGKRDFIKSLKEAILGGVTIVQLREKKASSLEFYNLAVKVKELTDKYNIPLIINDRVDIALAVDADGVHVGQDDMPANVVRRILVKDKIVGVSIATLEEAQKAVEDGASYVGVGALYSTNTKKNTRSVKLELLKNIKENISIPVVGIGGINEYNIKNVIDIGVDGVAIVSAILEKQNIRKATQRLYDDFFIK